MPGQISLTFDNCSYYYAGLMLLAFIFIIIGIVIYNKINSHVVLTTEISFMYKSVLSHNGENFLTGNNLLRSRVECRCRALADNRLRRPGFAR